MFYLNGRSSAASLAAPTVAPGAAPADAKPTIWWSAGGVDGAASRDCELASADGLENFKIPRDFIVEHPAARCAQWLADPKRQAGSDPKIAGCFRLRVW
jgi:hypothetical protein